MARNTAVATLLYSEDYLPGVFTLGYQLRMLKGDRNIAILLLVSRDLYQDILSELSIDVLRKLYTQILVVDPIEGTAQNNENLKFLKRPELYFTLVKARLRELEYDQVLYLDGDTLPLSSDVFDLFEQVEVQHSEVAGAPDVGWPDMFNSGVLLLAPNAEMALRLKQFIKDNASLDGADQGILNQFFNANCDKGGIKHVEQRWIRLPFIYNVTMPNYGYESSPATTYFKQQIKLVHFIGENKPWRGWRGNDNDYSSHWNEVFLDFQSEYGLSQHMEKLNLELSPPPWKESLEEYQQEPERVFPPFSQEQAEAKHLLKQQIDHRPERVFPRTVEEERKIRRTARHEMQQKVQLRKQEKPERVFPTKSEEEAEERARRDFKQKPERIFPGSEDKKEEEEDEQEEEILEVLEDSNSTEFKQGNARSSPVGCENQKRSSYVERVFPGDS
ncbi:GLG2 (YJL137C) and GLG1 (YKR058W) [Zygosaccharomyces parabailii]|nr:GLG2 (YJL137C) and GLG1 (YKR058W) [Zygosaccharomyces parabailii]